MPVTDLNIDIMSVLPEMGISALAVIVLILDLIDRKGSRDIIEYVSTAGLVLLLPLLFIGISVKPVFGGMLLPDSFAAFFNVIFVVAALITVLISRDYLRKTGMRRGEYYYIILFATLGMMVMASASDLLTLYVGLELMALSFYVLVAMRFDRAKSTEASLKYFILGALSSGILLYGISFTYGVSGTTNLAAIATNLKGMSASASEPFLLFGIAMIIAGFAFKIALFPFHVWAPDTYEGAPTPITALLSVGSKGAALAVFLRVFITAFPGSYAEWSQILWVLSAATMIFGSVVAISQKNIIRMLAYSSIAHAGIIIMGLLSYNQTGMAGVLYYLLVYLFMNMGAFAIVIMLMRKDGKWEAISDYRGLANKSPFTALLFALFLLSLAGVPPTGGFMAKFYIFLSAVKSQYYLLASIAVISTAVSLYFYLRVIFFMILDDYETDTKIPVRGLGNDIALLCTAAGTLLLGIYPGPFIDMAIYAVKSILI